MYTAHNMYGAVDISQPLIEEYQKDLNGFHSLKDKMMRCTLYEFGLIKAFLISQGYNPGITIRMIEAHGHSTPGGQYSYADRVGEQITLFPLEEWIETNDGNYDTLFVNCCNPGGVELKVKESLLVYPMDNTPGNEIYQIMNQNKKSRILHITLPSHPKIKYNIESFNIPNHPK